jgi:hypothetical protein
VGFAARNAIAVIGDTSDDQSVTGEPINRFVFFIVFWKF